MLNVLDTTKNVYLQDGIHKSMRIYFPGLDMTFTNERIVSGTFRLTESIQSSGNLEFIGCIASNLSVTLADLTVDVKGQKIEVYVTAGETEEISLFHGVVDSASKQSYKNHKEIIAYDVLYTLSQTNVATWYNNHSKTTIAKIFTDLMEYVGVEVKSVTWINGHLPAYCAESQVAESLSALDILKSICQINGVFGRINREGKFETISINTDENAAFNIEDHENMEHEDYAVKLIDSVIIRESSSDGGTEYGIGTNKYIIQGNMFAVDFTSNEVTEAVYNIYTTVSNITYIPFEADTYGLPFIECGDQVIFEDVDLSDLTSTKKYFFVFSRTLSNINGMRDNFTAEGEEVYSEFTSDVSTNLSSIKSQMGEYNLIRFVYRNIREISINDIENFLFEIKNTTKVSRPIFLAEIIVDVIPNKEVKQSTVNINGVSSVVEQSIDVPVEVSFQYTLDGEIVEFYPKETLTAGKHTLNLIYALGDLDSSSTFAVYMTAIGGEVNIGENNIIATIFGQGKATAAVEWDGTINIEEGIKAVTIDHEITVANLTDEVSISSQMPTGITFGENFAVVTINNIINVTGLTDAVSVNHVVLNHVINTSKQPLCEFNDYYVTCDDTFALRTEYRYRSSEQSIDSGRMTVIKIITEDKASVESMEVM